jgi:hypothetical protein
LELVNGGAVVAILTFYGNIVKDGADVPIGAPEIAQALGYFAGGLGAALVASVCAYLAQLFVATCEPDKSISKEVDDAYRTRRTDLSNRMILAALLAAAVSLILFGVGVWRAMIAFTG